MAERTAAGRVGRYLVATILNIVLQLGRYSFLLLGIGIVTAAHIHLENERAATAPLAWLLDNARAARVAEVAGPEAAGPSPVKVHGRIVALERAPGATVVGQVCLPAESVILSESKSRRSSPAEANVHFALDDGSGVLVRVNPARVLAYVLERETSNGLWRPSRSVLAWGYIALGPEGPELRGPQGDRAILSSLGEAETRAQIESGNVRGWHLYPFGGVWIAIGVLMLYLSHSPPFTADPPAPSSATADMRAG